MANPFEQFVTPEASDNPFAQFAEEATFTRTAESGKDYIKPGDVEARRKQGADNTAREQQPNVARERLGGNILTADNPGQAVLNALKGVASEAFGGARDLVLGGLDAGAAAREGNFMEAGANLLKSGIGGIRAIASPTAPLYDVGSEAGEATHRLLSNLGLETGADVGAAGMQTMFDMLSGRRLKEVTGMIKPEWAKTGFASNRSLANTAKGELADVTKRDADAIAAMKAEKEGIKGRTAAALREKKAGLEAAELDAAEKIEEIQRQSKAALKEKGATLSAAEREAAEKIKGIEGSYSAAEESVNSIREAAEKSVPSANDIRARFAKDAPLGKNVGAEFKGTYKTRLSDEKRRFNQMYEEKLHGTGDIEQEAKGYTAALDEVLGEKGISRPRMTEAEKVASKAKGILDVSEESAEQLAELKGSIARAKDPGSKRYLEDALKEHLEAGELGETPTVREMVKELQRLKEGQRMAVQAKNDNLTRQYKKLIEGLESDIPSDVLEGLEEVNTAYRNEFIPYFGRKSVTRAIADGAPEKVVDSIVLPAGNKKAVETINRASELIDDPKQWANVQKAFTNKAVESAFENGVFHPEKLTAHWKRFADPTGTNNEVLRKLYGKDYEDMASVVRQMERAKAVPFSEVAKKLTSSFRQNADTAIEGVRSQLKGTRDAIRAERQGIREQASETVGGINRELSKTRRGTQRDIHGIRDAAREQESLASVRIKNAETAAKYTQKQIEEKIANLMGTPVGKLTNKLESIGAGVFTSGGIRTVGGGGMDAAKTGIFGGVIAVSAGAVGKLLETMRGRSLLKAVLRGEPGTSQTAALARQIQSHLKDDDGD